MRKNSDDFGLLDWLARKFLRCDSTIWPERRARRVLLEPRRILHARCAMKPGHPVGEQLWLHCDAHIAQAGHAGPGEQEEEQADHVGAPALPARRVHLTGALVAAAITTAHAEKRGVRETK